MKTFTCSLLGAIAGSIIYQVILVLAVQKECEVAYDLRSRDKL